MRRAPKVAIIDYRMGNLFSVRQACVRVGLDAEITDDRATIRKADLVILPGVGAFRDAMERLHAKGLVEELRSLAEDGRPLVGVCLGMQLFMSESLEFGHHEGIGLIPGIARSFESPREGRRVLKVPQVGWNHVSPHPDASAWRGTPLESTEPGEYFYFVHSYYCVPEEDAHRLALTSYGDIEFCSAVRYRNVFACQFHPERSGQQGLNIYRDIAASIGARESTS